MKDYRPNIDNLKGIVENLYHAFSGDKPDDKMKERLYAGVDGLAKLYEESPAAFYTLAAMSLSEGASKFGLQSPYATLIAQYLVASMIDESGINPKGDLENLFGGK